MSGARRRWVLASLVVMATLPACGFTRVDAPLSFRSDRRLSIESPDAEAEVQLPLRVRWTVKDFDLGDGNHFGLFVDRAPVGQKKLVRLRVCTEREKLPPQLGEFRTVCKDDRETVFFTDDLSFTFDCFEPRFTAPKRERNKHTVTVVLLNKDNRRVGQAASTVRFDVDDADADQCRGL